MPGRSDRFSLTYRRRISSAKSSLCGLIEEGRQVHGSASKSIRAAPLSSLMPMLRTIRDLMLLFFSRKADSAFLGGGAAMVGTAVVVDAPATSGVVVTAGSAGAALIDAPTAMSGAIATAWRRGAALLVDAPTAMPGGMVTAGRRGAALIDALPVMLGAKATAGRRGASVDTPSAMLGAGETEARRDTSLVFDRRSDPRLPDAIELDGLGEGGYGGGRLVY